MYIQISETIEFIVCIMCTYGVLCINTFHGHKNDKPTDTYLKEEEL